MKIDKEFFEQRWVKAVGAEFGAQGVLAVIRLLMSVYDSDGGYWRDWSRMDLAVLAGEAGLEVADAERLMERLCEYGVVDGAKLRKEGVVTSAGIQREYIRQAGAARARRLEWKRHVALGMDQLLELGVAPAIYGSDSDEPYGVPLPVYAGRPHLCQDYRRVRLRHPDPRAHVYRVVRASRVAGGSGAAVSGSGRSHSREAPGATVVMASREMTP